MGLIHIHVPAGPVLGAPQGPERMLDHIVSTFKGLNDLTDERIFCIFHPDEDTSIVKPEGGIFLVSGSILHELVR